LGKGGRILVVFSASDMGIPFDDDVVLIQHGKEPGEPSVITVNCPDKAGLGCDLSRIILEFGLTIARAGIFCFCSFVKFRDFMKFVLLFLFARFKIICLGKFFSMKISIFVAFI
jgi:hypothetical protein